MPDPLAGKSPAQVTLFQGEFLEETGREAQATARPSGRIPYARPDSRHSRERHACLAGSTAQGPERPGLHEAHPTENQAIPQSSELQTGCLGWDEYAPLVEAAGFRCRFLTASNDGPCELSCDCTSCESFMRVPLVPKRTSADQERLARPGRHPATWPNREGWARGLALPAAAGNEVARYRAGMTNLLAKSVAMPRELERWLDVTGGRLDATARIDVDADPAASLRIVGALLLRKARIRAVAVLRAHATSNLPSLAVQMRPVLECAGQVVFLFHNTVIAPNLLMAPERAAGAVGNRLNADHYQTLRRITGAKSASKICVRRRLRSSGKPSRRCTRDGASSRQMRWRPSRRNTSGTAT